jgi:hypothetical protein
MPAVSDMWKMLVVFALAAACSTPVSPGPRATDVPQPFPFTTPTPPLTPTSLDGTYTRTVTADVLGAPGHCRRCPPYRLAEGPERMTLERGVFHIEQAGGHLTVGHFQVAGDRITLFNDPNCPQARGTYRWAEGGGNLRFELVSDDCAFGNLRARYLMALPWRVGS